MQPPGNKQYSVLELGTGKANSRFCLPHDYLVNARGTCITRLIVELFAVLKKIPRIRLFPTAMLIPGMARLWHDRSNAREHEPEPELPPHTH